MPIARDDDGNIGADSIWDRAKIPTFKDEHGVSFEEANELFTTAEDQIADGVVPGVKNVHVTRCVRVIRRGRLNCA
jgi:uncharacterized DUF497 family protein